MGGGGGNFVYLYVFPSPFLPSPPPAAAWLRCPAFASGVAAPSQKTDRCPCSASAVSAAGSASAAQSRTCGRLPSQSRRPCGRLASSPGGRAKFTPVGRRKLCSKTKFFSFALPQTLSRLTQVHLPPPAGAVEPTASSGRNREAKLAQRSTFHKGIHARWEKWLSARGGGTALCAVTEREGSHVYGGAVERSETERAIRRNRLRGQQKSARSRALRAFVYFL